MLYRMELGLLNSYDDGYRINNVLKDPHNKKKVILFELVLFYSEDESISFEI